MKSVAGRCCAGILSHGVLWGGNAPGALLLAAVIDLAAYESFKLIVWQGDRQHPCRPD